jgi:UrcA family protein
MNTVVPVACLIALGSMSGLALGAASTDELPRQVVSYADLDLSRPAGAATLYARIRSAAHAVCEPQMTTDLWTYTYSQRCTRDAIARAVADVNAPLLVTLHRTQTPSLARAR